MKVSHVALAVAAATVANAQLDIPQCALPCLLDALSASSCDDTFDFACQCKQTGLVDIVVPCVKEACETADQQSTVDAVTKACNGAGVPIEIPPIGGETSGIASTSAASPEPTEESTTTFATTSDEATGSAEPSSIPTGTDSSAPAEPTPTGPAVPDSDNAGSGLKASFGGVAAGLLAVAAYL